MCGCSSGTTFGKSGSNTCRNTSSLLYDARNKLAILFNITTNPGLKAQYDSDKMEVEQLINDSNTSGVCPDYAIVIAIVNYVNNEYSKYNNG